MRTVSAKAGVRDARTADTARTSREIREIDRIISHSIQRPPWVSATSPRPEGTPRGFGILWMTVGLGLIALIFANAGAILANASARYELMAFKNANSLRKPEKRGKSLGQGGAKTATPILKSPEEETRSELREKEKRRCVLQSRAVARAGTKTTRPRCRRGEGVWESGK